MGHCVASAIFLVTLAIGAGAQTCSTSLPSECYYTGAGTISAGSVDSNLYFAIGGLFDVHEKGDNGMYCSSKISAEGMTNLLAFYWSINKYSNEILRQRQMTVGAIAFDNCMRTDQTIENVLSFSQCKVQVQGLNRQNVVAYVGPYTNMDTHRTGMLAQDLKITLVSPGASSMDFDMNHQETLLRVRPSLAYDVRAIHAFLEHQHAEFVLIVHSKPFQAAYDSLYHRLDQEPTGSNAPTICHYMHFMLDENASDDDITEVAEQLMKYHVGKYVVPLVSKELALKLMDRTLNDQVLIYILHSEIGRDSAYVLPHAIIVEPAMPVGTDLTVLQEFNAFLKEVSKHDNTTKDIANLGRLDVTNPWLDAFIQQPNVMLPDLMSAPSPVTMNAWRTIVAVKVIIDGMHQGILNKCARNSQNNYQFCDELRNLPDHEDELYAAIKADRFGDDGQWKASTVTYNYYVYDQAADNYAKIGSIVGDQAPADITEDLTDAKYGPAFSGNVCPDELSCCHEPTDAPATDGPTEPPTAPPTTPMPSDLVYVLYPDDKEITGAFSTIDRDGDDYGTRFDLDQKWILALGVLAGLGVLCVLVFEVYILYKMVGKKVDNKWRTMWLGQLLLFGIFLSYLVCFAFLFIPTKATCGITRFGVGVAYATCFAVLLVKLMVILTSKNSDVLLPGDVDSPNYLKGVYQFLMFVFAVGVQIVINVQWLITVPPEAIRVTSHAGEQVWICNHYTWKTGDDMLSMDSFVRSNFENHLLSLSYIMVMILIITILSLNAHGIITNHRESVFIGIAAGFSIPLWLAWGLVGGLNKDKDYGHEYGDACLAFGLFLTATLILFAMFLPKVRQLGNMGVEGIYLEDDRETIYGGSIIMAPPSYKSKGGIGTPSSVIYVNNQGIYSEPVVVGNGDSNKMATYLKHPMSTYSAPPTYLKKTESTYGGSRVLRVTDDLKGRHPLNNRASTKKPLSEVNYGTSGRPRSMKGTLPRSRSQSDLGAL